MNGEPRPIEIAIRGRLEAGDRAGAMTAAVEGYGAELFGFLLGLAGDRDRAGDAFGAACERMWRALEQFRWDCSFRAWMYTIARNEFLTGITRDRRLVPLSGIASVDQAVERVRTATPMHVRSEVKERFAKVRETLSPDDHILLGLRLDRRLTWPEIERIFADGETKESPPSAAALRKRYQRLKERLEALADEVLGES